MASVPRATRLRTAPRPAARGGVATALSNLSELLSEVGCTAEALTASAEAVAILRLLATARPRWSSLIWPWASTTTPSTYSAEGASRRHWPPPALGRIRRGM
ncbi:hypothetical protein GCM10009554_19960 [Kribbella koreensis]|uniref:Uncharacterized protein n=1 Tax=Kribbella koreensis TaxID=57909 RepID=A0ABN1PW11_9ACTN